MISSLLAKAGSYVTDAATSGAQKATRMLTTSRESRTVGDYYGNVTGRLANDSGEDADLMLKMLRGEGSAEDLGLTAETGKVLSAVKERFSQGTLSSNEAIGAMYQNVKDTGEVFGGISRAGETLSQATGFGALGNPSNIIGSAAMGAFVGAGASSITGGDTTEGAIIGGMVGAGGSIGARVFRESLGAIEESVMKKALDTKFITKDIAPEQEVLKGMPLAQISRSELQGRTLGELTGNPLMRDANVKLSDASDLQKKGLSYIEVGGQEFDEVVGRSARNQNLDAISKIDLKDAPDNLNFIDKQVIKNMQSKDSASMGVQSRFATISGAALAGMAFTSSAGSDKRRGFNRNRGNRI